MTTEFSFDIEGTPPTVEAIENERQRLEAGLSYLTRLGWVVIAGLGLLAAGLWFAWWQGGMTNAVAVAVAGAAVAGFFVTVWFDDAKEKLHDRIALLTPSPKAACVEIATWSKIDPAVDSYRASVVGQGRQITHGEYQAMQAWINGRSERLEQDEQQRKVELACRDVYGVSA